MQFNLFLQTNTNGSSPSVANISNIPIGDVVAGEHSSKAFCVKPVASTETTFSNVEIYLESLDGLDAEIGYYINSAPYQQQEPNNANMASNHFTEQSDAAQGDPNGVALPVTDNNVLPWVWIDAEVASNQTELNTVTNKKRFDLNFRIIFDFT